VTLASTLTRTCQCVATFGELCLAVLPLFASYAPSGVKSQLYRVPVTGHALVLPHLDYCNSVLYGLPTSLIRRLQSVQNATARFIFGIRRSEHISPALISLHWLCIPERISFKLAVLTYRAIHGAGPSYLCSSLASLASQTCRHDDDCVRPALIACTYYRSFVDLQSAVAHSQFLALRYGTTCRLTSQLRRHSRSSDSAARHFCFRAHTLTLSSNPETTLVS